jgi:hypothetical protein
VTGQRGNFAQKAHIVAFSFDGPRGDELVPDEEINAFENLMLLCYDCHKLVDDNPEDYSAAELRAQKNEHQERIFQLTSYAASANVTVVSMLGDLYDKPAASLTDEMIREAVEPDFPLRDDFRIELSGLRDLGSAARWQVAREAVDAEVERLEAAIRSGRTNARLAVFALGRIPIMAYLGWRLRALHEVRIFQQDHDLRRWAWQNGESETFFDEPRPIDDVRSDVVALTVATSGKIERDQLPEELRDDVELWTIGPLGLAVPGNIKHEYVVQEFRQRFREALAVMHEAHPQLECIHIFFAAPPAIVVAAGLERLPRINPRFVVYDREARDHPFTFAMELA